VLADAAYNHHLLQEHLQAEEQIVAERAEQEALLESYRSARESRLMRWRYRMRVAEVAAAYKEGDEAGEALFGETDDEAEDNAGFVETPPRRHRGGGLRRLRRGPAPPRLRPANNEAEDIAGFTEAPPCRQREGGFPPSRRGATPSATRQRTSPAPSRPRLAANEATPHRKRGRVEHGRSPPLGSK
jgi:hypothetical protein